MAQQFSASDFEKLVAQMIRVLSEMSAQVSRDTRTSDPDTGGCRQIDVLVDDGGYKTHFECRHHVKPQDVKWIEELMGRRLSLRADAMVGVSSSGFTGPALIKAKECKIGLLDMREFLPESIASLPSMYFKYIQLENLKVHLVFPT
jgi:predicted Mrr-cat superfamily restriction endonuclease